MLLKLTDHPHFWRITYISTFITILFSLFRLIFWIHFFEFCSLFFIYLYPIFKFPSFLWDYCFSVSHVRYYFLVCIFFFLVLEAICLVHFLLTFLVCRSFQFFSDDDCWIYFFIENGQVLLSGSLTLTVSFQTLMVAIPYPFIFAIL